MVKKTKTPARLTAKNILKMRLQQHQNKGKMSNRERYINRIEDQLDRTGLKVFTPRKKAEYHRDQTRHENPSTWRTKPERQTTKHEYKNWHTKAEESKESIDRGNKVNKAIAIRIKKGRNKKKRCDIQGGKKTRRRRKRKTRRRPKKRSKKKKTRRKK